MKKEINKICELVDVFYKHAQEVDRTSGLPATVISGLWPVILPTLQKTLDVIFNEALDKIYASGSLGESEDYAGGVIISPNFTYSAQKGADGKWQVTEAKFQPFSKTVSTPYFNNADPKYIKFFNNIPTFIPKAEALMSERIQNELNKPGNQSRFGQYGTITKYPVVLKEQLEAST